MRTNAETNTSLWDRIVLAASLESERDRLERRRSAKLDGKSVVVYPFGFSGPGWVSWWYGYQGVLDALKLAVITLYPQLSRAEVYKPYLGSRTAQCVVVGFFALALLLPHIAPDPERGYLARLAARARIARARSARLGRRWSRALDRLAADQSAYQEVWSQPSWRTPSDSKLPRFGRGDLGDPRVRNMRDAGFCMLFCAGFLSDIFSPVLGDGYTGPILMTFGLILLIWSYVQRPFGRELPRLVAQVRLRRCADCGFDLSSAGPALASPADSLGPARCTECGLAWPLVVPCPPWFERGKESPSKPEQASTSTSTSQDASSSSG